VRLKACATADPGLLSSATFPSHWATDPPCSTKSASRCSFELSSQSRISFQHCCSKRHVSGGEGGNTAARVLLLALLLDCCCFAHSCATVHVEAALAREKTIPEQGQHRVLIRSRYFYCFNPPPSPPAACCHSKAYPVPLCASSACVLLWENYGGEVGTHLHSSLDY
jgi:hypothetical protein